MHETISGFTVVFAKVSALVQIIRLEFTTDDTLLSSVEALPNNIQWNQNVVPAWVRPISMNSFETKGYSSEDTINAIVVATLLLIGLRTRRRVRQQTISAPSPPDLLSNETSLAKPPAILREMEGSIQIKFGHYFFKNVWLGRKRDESDFH
jgi:hypothetical protein